MSELPGASELRARAVASMGVTRVPAPGGDAGAWLPRWIGLGAFVVFVVINVVIRVGDHPTSVALGTSVALAGGIPLFCMRWRFAVGFAVVAIAGVVVAANGAPGDVGWFALAVIAAWCVYSGGLRVGIAAWGACLLILGGEWLWSGGGPGWAPWMAGITVTVLAAILVRHQLTLVEQLRQAQVGLAERARLEERTRIARELHDVIAHTLTVSLLHVSSARLAVEHDPADAARSLAEAERLGRESLAEVRATMGLLRSEGSQGVAPPTPGLDQLQELIGQVSQAGVDISFEMEGDLAAVPATTGSTIYRIVQEALTNATKHASGYPIKVAVAAGGGRLGLSVDSGGPPKRGSGMGLENMRQRAEAVGGTCSAGPGGSGWLVRASLPIDNERGSG